MKRIVNVVCVAASMLWLAGPGGIGKSSLLDQHHGDLTPYCEAFRQSCRRSCSGAAPAQAAIGAGIDGSSHRYAMLGRPRTAAS